MISTTFRLDLEPTMRKLRLLRWQAHRFHRRGDVAPMVHVTLRAAAIVAWILR